jgi:lipopolysaccharide/colanic/teichoic acid biosynthesis glycosyltransferase
MQAGAPTALHESLIQELASDSAARPSLQKLTGDPRVTRVGAFLRRWSIDELPQLFNVLSGDMSLVGPRPAIPYELEVYRPGHDDRFRVRPGLTGLWQVSGRSQLGLLDMLDLDAEYARQPSMATDLRILAKTPLALVGKTA